MVSVVALGQVSSGNSASEAPAASAPKTCKQIDACRRAVAWHRHKLAKAERAIAWQRRQAAKIRMQARALSASLLTPLEVGRELALRVGIAGRQWACLVTLWSRESGWIPTKANYAGSGAYGIPQSLPGSKMAAMGADWRTNAATQIRWGLHYIEGRYGSPCAALANSNAHGYY